MTQGHDRLFCHRPYGAGVVVVTGRFAGGFLVMRSIFLALAVLVWFGGGALAQAGEAVALNGQVTGVMQFPTTQTICLTFTTKEKKDYMICDDITAKDVIEQLFALGKKDAPCHIEGTVSQKSGEDVRLAVTRVSQGQ